MPAMHPICLSSSGASSPNPPPPPPPPSTLAGGISSSDSDSSPITSSRTSNCRAAQLRKPRSKQRLVLVELRLDLLLLLLLVSRKENGSWRCLVWNGLVFQTV
uniref:Uncharacterized protein n=1 Tax=Oryza nivara TaxID=4536 RepID=A0A0E0I3E5_ORYNI